MLSCGLVIELAIKLLCLIFYLFFGAFVYWWPSIDVELSNKNLTERLSFCFVSISTIGYGNNVPQGDSSNWFTMFYNFFGIPLFNVVCEQISQTIKAGIESFVKFFTQKPPAPPPLQAHQQLMTLIICCSTILFLALGFWIVIVVLPNLYHYSKGGYKTVNTIPAEVIHDITRFMRMEEMERLRTASRILYNPISRHLKKITDAFARSIDNKLERIIRLLENLPTTTQPFQSVKRHDDTSAQDRTETSHHHVHAMEAHSKKNEEKSLEIVTLTRAKSNESRASTSKSKKDEEKAPEIEKAKLRRSKSNETRAFVSKSPRSKRASESETGQRIKARTKTVSENESTSYEEQDEDDAILGKEAAQEPAGEEYSAQLAEASTVATMAGVQVLTTVTSKVIITAEIQPSEEPKEVEKAQSKKNEEKAPEVVKATLTRAKSNESRASTSKSKKEDEEKAPEIEKAKLRRSKSNETRASASKVLRRRPKYQDQARISLSVRHTDDVTKRRRAPDDMEKIDDTGGEAMEELPLSIATPAKRQRLMPVNLNL
ncbi:ion channel domain-containing protein [Ditylenchus destructor]|nr:ion channel domain-containing protein [Ditylenchus destructor]